MKKLNEDYTAGKLRGIPIFCVNRFYEADRTGVIHKVQYIFEFGNGYSASIVEFTDRKFSGGYQYEMLANIPGVGGNDVERGDERDMHKLLCELEEMAVVKSIDN